MCACTLDAYHDVWLPLVLVLLRQLLEAHRKLCEAREDNVQKFGAVLDALEKKAGKS